MRAGAGCRCWGFSAATRSCSAWPHWPSTLPSRYRAAALLAAFDACAPLAGESQRHAVESIERELEVEPLGADGLMMGWDEARSLARRGHIVGSHTRTHPHVAYVKDAGVLHAELAESKRKLEAELGAPVMHFPYPHPALNSQWSEQTLALTRRAGYGTAVLTRGGPVRSGDDPLLLTRIRTPNSETEFLCNLQSSFLGHRV